MHTRMTSIAAIRSSHNDARRPLQGSRRDPRNCTLDSQAPHLLGCNQEAHNLGLTGTGSRDLIASGASVKPNVEINEDNAVSQTICGKKMNRCLEHLLSKPHEFIPPVLRPHYQRSPPPFLWRSRCRRGRHLMAAPRISRRWKCYDVNARLEVPGRWRL